jgi:D-galactarolactone cycloisomerase
MRIHRVKTYVLKAALPDPFFFSQPGWVRQRASTVVEITTDDGLSGFGEALCHGLQPPEIACSVIDDCLGEMIVGADPFDVGVLFELMYNRVKDFGPKGVTIAALSAIDIAIWDLMGKATGKPVHKLLGGAFRCEVEPYATGFYRTAGGTYPHDLVLEAVRHVHAGFRAMKVKIGFGLHEDIEAVAAVRKAIGPDIRLMVDANHAYNRAVARRLIKDLDEYDVYWLEEPISPEDLEGYVDLRAIDRRLMIAAGENEFTRHGFWPWVTNRAVDILQPDITASGGFTGLRQISDIALAGGTFLNPHVWGTAIGLAASLQFLAAIPSVPISRGATEPLLEFDQSAHPFRAHLVTNPIEMRDGRVAIPDRPGIGVDIDRDVLERLSGRAE